MKVEEIRDAPTEERLAATDGIDRWSAKEILEAIHHEDRNAFEAVQRVLPEIEAAVGVLVRVVESGGRWFNVGAGTSGRMGALDAAELPPTFGIDPERVQAIVAGGDTAMRRAVEGAEDDAQAGARVLEELGLGERDAVLGISASGRTTFTCGALEAASRSGAETLALTCDSASPLAQRAHISIAPEVGPEVIAGSTRMKGGLAQKMVLHLLSTTAMVRLGRVAGNLMTNLTPVNAKLRERALRILMSLGKVDEARARALLEQFGGDVSAALALLER